MSADLQPAELKRKRNLAIAIAAAAMVASLGVSLPRRLARYHEQKQANQELLALQAEIVAAQGNIRYLQAEILKVQAELNRGK